MIIDLCDHRHVTTKIQRPATFVRGWASLLNLEAPYEAILIISEFIDLMYNLAFLSRFRI